MLFSGHNIWGVFAEILLSISLLNRGKRARFSRMSDLCLNCNLCCNGSLFARVPVTEEEQARLPDDLSFFRRNGNLRMRLPCPRLGEDGGCTVYADRPAVCRTYHCKLSKRVEAGDVAEERALAIIAEIKKTQKNAVALAAQAMGKTVGDYAPAQIGRVFRHLKQARKDATQALNGFAASRAHIQRDRFDRLVRKHLQSNFKGGG